MAIGGGIGGVIIAIVLALMMGGDPSEAVQQAIGNQMGQNESHTPTVQ